MKHAVRLIGVLFTAAALLGVGLAARAAMPAVPPVPTRWVTDVGGFLSPTTRDTLDSALQAYESRTGHQVLVYIGTTTGAVPLEQYTVGTFAAWNVGRKGLDDGLVLFVFPQDHRLRIEVGYGLESVVTDADAFRIIHDVITPLIRSGDNDGAITNGVAQILQQIDGSPAPEMNGAGSAQAGGSDETGGAPDTTTTIAEYFVGIVLLIVFVVLFIRSPGLALWLLFSILSGARGGGGFGGGGGFSGGGGRSGGGGASGSW